MIAVDTETTLFTRYEKVRTEFDPPDLVCISFCQPHTGLAPNMAGNANVYTAEMGEAPVRNWLNSDEDLVFHNAAFDISVLLKAYPAHEELWRQALKDQRILDTRVMYCLRLPDGRPGRSLAAACERVLGRTLEKGDVRTSFRPGVPLTDEQRSYAIADAVNTYDLANALKKMPYGGLSRRPSHFHAVHIHAESSGTFDPDREFSASAAWMSLELEPRGLGVHPERLASHLSAQESLETEHFAALEAAGLAKWVRKPKAPVKVAPPHLIGQDGRWRYAHDGDTWMLRRRKGVDEIVEAKRKLETKKLKELYSQFANDAGLKPSRPGLDPMEGEYGLSEKGSISLKYDHWKRFGDDLPEVLRHHLQYAKSGKLLNTYLRPLRDSGATHVHSSYLVAFAETARWTCNKPNTQNIPKTLKNLFRAPNRKFLVSADYKSLEMYTLVEAMHRLGLGGGPMRALLDLGGDTHTNAAAMIFNKEPEDVNKTERQTAKICGFALLGGLGPRKFLSIARGAGLDWSIGDAQETKERYFATFSDAACFLQRFRVDPYTLRPAHLPREEWLARLGFSTEEWVSRFDLGRSLNDGAIYEVALPSGRIVPNRRYSQSANLFFQGIGAEVISAAFNRCCAAGLSVCAVVHDSITIESDAGGAGIQLAQCMKEAEEQVVSCGVKIPLPEFEVSEEWK